MPSRTFWAPGRVNLIGEHTDHSGGLVLPAAIDRGITLTAEPGGGRIVLSSDRMPEEVDVPADGSQAPASGWGRYVAAVAAELHAVGRPAVGLRGRVSSDLPDGAGLSSSAALEVCVATALCAVAHHPLPPLELARVGQRAEQRAVGVPCGIMDQAASVLGVAGHAVLLDCTSHDHRPVPLPQDLALVVIDSGVRRRLEDSGYRQRLEELRPGLDAVRAAGRRSPADVQPEEVVDLAAAGGLDEVATRRLRHVVTENARVRAVVRVLTQPDGGADQRAGRDARRQALGRLFAESHASLRDDFEVSIPALDRLVKLAVEAGAVAARMTGGGFGGAIVVLAERNTANQLGAEVVARYGQDGHARATVLVTTPADGATEVSGRPGG